MSNSAYQFGIGICVMAAVLILGVTVHDHGAWSSIMASWVQGVGTIGGIFAAIFVAERAITHDQRRARQKKFQLVEAVELARSATFQYTFDIFETVKIEDEMRKSGIATTMDLFSMHLAISHGARSFLESGCLDGFDKILEEGISEWPSYAFYLATLRYRQELAKAMTAINDAFSQFPAPMNKRRLIGPAIGMFDLAETSFEHVRANLRI